MTKNEKKKNVEPIEEAELIQNEEVLKEAEQTTEEEMVTISRQEYDEMQQQIENACQKADNHLDGWHRERADFSNYKKRMDREQAQIRQTITGEVIKKYLVILDDISLALKNRPNDGDGAAWSQGIELIAQKLETILEQEGIQTVAEEKGEFDPTCHEAISSEESAEHESGEIIEVMQQGYRMPDGRVLRPAIVRVAR